MFTDSVIAEALSPRSLALILLPTEKCNFRCTYCYEDFAIGRMSPGVIRGVKRLIERRIDSIDRLSISWFGGEPLLAKNIVLDIGEFAYDLCDRRGVEFSAGFTTNGFLLTSDLFERLIASSQKHFQITLDGDEEWHDRTRVMANRGATFKKIWSNLMSFKEFAGDFSITLRLHLHKHNVESVKRLYDRIGKDLLSDNRFSVYFHKISDLGGAGDVVDSVLPRDEYMAAIRYITGTDNAPAPPGNAISEEHLSGYICYAAKPNSLMIRANGGVGKCTVALSDDRNDIGRLSEDGLLDISNEKLRRWMNGFSDLSEQSLGCPLSVMQ